ncbi:MAG: NusG domain II-containing protein [Nitrospirota bacterium]
MNLKELIKSTTIADRILFFILILFSISGIVFIKEVLPKGRTVQIEVNGQPVYVLPLEKDRIVSVEGRIGRTVIEIKNHKVRLIESPCPNKLCIKQGWIDSGAIVCLPNRVVVTIGDYRDENPPLPPFNKDREIFDIDAITG